MLNSPLSNEVLGKSRQLELALVQNEREEDLHGREHPQLLEVALKEGSKRKGHGIWDKSSLRSAGYSVTKLFECKEEDYPYPQNAAATSTPIGHEHPCIRTLCADSPPTKEMLARIYDHRFVYQARAASTLEFLPQVFCEGFAINGRDLWRGVAIHDVEIAGHKCIHRTVVATVFLTHSLPAPRVVVVEIRRRCPLQRGGTTAWAHR